MDVFCDYRRYGINSRRERIVGWIKIPQLRFLFVFRLASLYNNNILLKMLCRHYAIKYGYQSRHPDRQRIVFGTLGKYRC